MTVRRDFGFVADVKNTSSPHSSVALWQWAPEGGPGSGLVEETGKRAPKSPRCARLHGDSGHQKSVQALLLLQM